MKRFIITLISLVAVALFAATAMAGSTADMFNAFDKDKDNSIDREEWFEFMTQQEMKKMQREAEWQKGMEKEKGMMSGEEEMTKEMGFMTYEELDLNKDGRVTKDEYRSARYSAIDTNHDDSIDRNEWFKFMEGKR